MRIFLLFFQLCAVICRRYYKIVICLGCLLGLVASEFVIPSADKILWMEGGTLADCGTHGELLDRGGAYARVYRMQAEKGGEDA